MLQHADGHALACQSLRQLASVAGQGGRLAAAVVPAATTFATAEGVRPRGWGPLPSDTALIQTAGQGTVRGSLQVPQGGPKQAWLMGSFGAQVAVLVDGRRVAAAQDELAEPAGWLDLGEIDLPAGFHRVALARAGADPRPGRGPRARTLGSLVLRPLGSAGGERIVPARRWRSLCGRSLAWVDVLAPREN